MEKHLKVSHLPVFMTFLGTGVIYGLNFPVGHPRITCVEAGGPSTEARFLAPRLQTSERAMDFRKLCNVFLEHARPRQVCLTQLYLCFSHKLHVRPVKPMKRPDEDGIPWKATKKPEEQACDIQNHPPPPPYTPEQNSILLQKIREQL